MVQRIESIVVRPRRAVFTTGQIAKITKVAPRTVSKWFDSGRLKGYRIPGSQDRRVPREQLVRFLKEYGMPLGDLEDEEFYKVLFVGTGPQLAQAVAAVDLTESDGFRIDFADDAFGAGILLRDFKPDAIVIDLALGRPEALSVAKRVRDEEQGAERGTLLVAVRGEDDPPSENPWPWDAQIQRPFDPALLAEMLRRGKESAGA